MQKLGKKRKDKFEEEYYWYCDSESEWKDKDGRDIVFTDGSFDLRNKAGSAALYWSSKERGTCFLISNVNSSTETEILAIQIAIERPNIHIVTDSFAAVLLLNSNAKPEPWISKIVERISQESNEREEYSGLPYLPYLCTSSRE